MNDNLLAQFTIPYSTALFMGVAAGMSHCSVVCAPFISTYIMGSRVRAVEGLRSFVVFTAGRVFMCAMLGLGAGYIGVEVISAGRNIRYSLIIYGAALISVGLLMLMRPVCLCRESKNKNGLVALLSRRFVFNPTAHLFVMGMVLATIPCPPMGAILLYSLKMPSIISSGILMALFGIGTVISPLVIISIAAGWFSGKIRIGAPPQYRMMFQRLSGLILILLGAFSAISYM